MKRTVLPGVLAVLLALAAARAPGQDSGDGDTPATPAFRAVDVWLDAGGERLSAYQVELRYDRARMKLVSLEGGDDAAFVAPPYYDPAGLAGGRIVIAALTADDDVPRGRIRVARLHVMVEDGGAVPPVESTLVTAARPGGDRIAPEIELRETEGR